MLLPHLPLTHSQGPFFSSLRMFAWKTEAKMALHVDIVIAMASGLAGICVWHRRVLGATMHM